MHARSSWDNRRSLGALAFGLMVVVIATATGCGGASVEGGGPRRPLPAYSGTAAQLFDDAIEQRAVGLDLDASERVDGRVKDRTQASDAVLRIRIDTVTERNDGATVRYDLGAHTVEKITGDHPPSAEFNLRVDASSPAVGIVRALQARLSGKTFIAFVRPDGDSEIHFHLAADDKEVARAVRDANVLSELK